MRSAVQREWPPSDNANCGVGHDERPAVPIRFNGQSLRPTFGREPDDRNGVNIT